MRWGWEWRGVVCNPCLYDVPPSPPYSAPSPALYEWPTQWTEGIPHSRDAVIANSYGAFFFGEEARRNSRAFADPADEAAALIYNFAPLTGISAQFMQIYFFPH